jgi:ribonuclease BN (tRNA processing enzyme)
MKLHILGCHGPYAPKGGATSGYLLEGERESLALDMGSGTLGRLLDKSDIKPIRAVILSHLHFDHIVDLFLYGYYLRDRVMDVYLPNAELPQLEALKACKNFVLHCIEPDETVELGAFSCRFFQTVHPVKNCGVLVGSLGKSLAYTGDTVWFDALPGLVAQADLILADCAQIEGTRAPHMTQNEGVRLMTQTGKPVMATHLPPDFSRQTDRLLFAKEGEIVEI